MENILKLIVKKDLFDKLASGEQNYIYVDANGYWIRRLAVNSADSFNKLKETQAFRTFDVVNVTCAKETAQYQFKDIKTGNEDMTQNVADTGICILITTNKDISEKSETVASSDEPTNETVNVASNEEPSDENVTTVMTDECECPIEDETETEKEAELTTDFGDNEVFVNEAEKKDIKNTIDFIISVIGGYDNVVVVNRPNIIITSNGRIYGTKDKLDLNNDEEIRVNIGIEKLYDNTNNDKDFIKEIENYFIDYVKTGYIFIWKDGCEVVNTPAGRYIKLRMTKKLYLNR